MACFVVPAAEAVIATVAVQIAKSMKFHRRSLNDSCLRALSRLLSIKFRFQESFLGFRNLLWGGVLLLAFEHLWHGELTPYFPFLTGASNAEDTATMLHEMATVGVAMSLLVTAVWGIMLLVVKIKETKNFQRKGINGIMTLLISVLAAIISTAIWYFLC